MTSSASPEHVFDVQVDWQGPGEKPTTEVRRFRRASVASVPTSREVPALRLSAARTFFGDGNAWNPETLLLAALAQCHLSAFLRQAGLAGLSVVDASVSVRAWLTVMPDGSGRLTRAELTPRTVVERPAAAVVDSVPDGLGAVDLSAQLDALHTEAHRQCFIANSVNFPVEVLPDITEYRRKLYAVPEHMMSWILGVVLTFLAGTLGVWWVRKHRQRDRAHPHRQRMPRLVLVIAWIIILAGILVALVAWTDPPSDPTAMRIAAVCMILLPFVLLWMYRNWYVDIGYDRIDFRTTLGRTGSIVYRDITEYRLVQSNHHLMLKLRSRQGEHIQFSTDVYDASLLFRAKAFRDAQGRWPQEGELGVRGLRD